MPNKQGDKCKHNPKDLYSWFADSHKGKILVICCKACHTVLQGAYNENEESHDA